MNRVTFFSTCLVEAVVPHTGIVAVRTTLRALDQTEGSIVIPPRSCATMIEVFWPELFAIEGHRTNKPRPSGWRRGQSSSPNSSHCSRTASHPLPPTRRRQLATAPVTCCDNGDELEDLMSDDVLDPTAPGATRIVGCDVSYVMHLEGRSRH